METKKVTTKALKSLLNDSLREAIGRLELPKTDKKLDRIISKSSKKIASRFANILKKENRKAKKAEKAMTFAEDALKAKKERKVKKEKKKLKAVGSDN